MLTGWDQQQLINIENKQYKETRCSRKNDKRGGWTASKKVINDQSKQINENILTTIHSA